MLSETEGWLWTEWSWLIWYRVERPSFRRLYCYDLGMYTSSIMYKFKYVCIYTAQRNYGCATASLTYILQPLPAPHSTQPQVVRILDWCKLYVLITGRIISDLRTHTCTLETTKTLEEGGTGGQICTVS